MSISTLDILYFYIDVVKLPPVCATCLYLISLQYVHRKLFIFYQLYFILLNFYIGPVGQLNFFIGPADCLVFFIGLAHYKLSLFCRPGLFENFPLFDCVQVHASDSTTILDIFKIIIPETPGRSASIK